jgi:AcrR family transcriptional regulator
MTVQSSGSPEEMKKTRNQVIAEYRTGEILQAASVLFSQRGFTGTTVEDIARASGMAKGTVYLYFSSKEEIFQSAFKRNITELKTRSLAALGQTSTIAERILAFLRAKVGYFEEHRSFFVVYISEILPGSQGGACLQEVIAEARREQVERLADILNQAVATGEVRPVRAREVASAIFDLTRSVVVQRMSGCTDVTPEDDVSLIFDLIWKGLAPS